MKKLVLVAGVIWAGAIFIATARAEGIKEGKWKMNMTTKMEGAMGQEQAEAMKEMENMAPEEKAMMQQMMGHMGMGMGASDKGMTITMTQCMTNDNPVPQNDHEKDCTETHSMKGNTIHFEMDCKDSISSGQVTYKDKSMKGMIKSKQKAKNKGTDMMMEIDGEYVGPCEE